MGADLKRKEARKRKFGGEHLEGSSADEPLKKKSRQILQPAFPEKAAVVGENGKSATLKAQRFIVFIGPYARFKYAQLGRLTILSSHQAIYHILQRMSQ